jgi:hypothetical protein
MGMEMESTEDCTQPGCHGSITVKTVYDDDGNQISIEYGACSSGLH